MRKLITLLLLAVSLTLAATDYPGYPGFNGRFIYVDDEGFDMGTPSGSQFSYSFCFEYGYVAGEQMPVAILHNTTKEPADNGVLILPSYYNIVDSLYGTLMCKVIGIATDELFANGVTGFGVTNVVLPTELKFIVGNGALSFPNLLSLSLPASLEYMDVKALNQCSNLVELNIADSDKPLNIVGTNGNVGAFGVPPLVNAYLGKAVISGSSPFKRASNPTLKTVTLGGYGQPIYEEMFYNQTLLNTVTLKDGVGDIGDKAFFGCTALTGINIPGSVKRIGKSAFENDSAMTTLTMDEGVKCIGEHAFNHCFSVTSLTLPASLDSIHSEAFYSMRGVTTLRIADSYRPLRVQDRRYWANGLFSDMGEMTVYLGRNIALENGARVPFYMSKMVKLTMGPKVTTLNDEAFTQNEKLRSVTLGENLTIVPDKAFFKCSTLGGINIPASVKKIGASAFEEDSLMTSVTLNEGLKYIGRDAFKLCKSVTSLTLPASLDSIQSEAFNSMNGVTTLRIADSARPLRVQDRRYWANGLFSDMGEMTVYLGRNIALENGAFVPFFKSKMVKLTIGPEVTTLNDQAFTQNEKLRSATLSENLTIVPDKAFYHCTALTGINIPASVKTIGENAFECDSMMTAVTLNEGLKRIDRLAFSYCNRVTSLTLPASLDSIQSEAFNAMSGVTTLRVADSNQPLRVQDRRYAARGLFSDMGEMTVYLGRNIMLENGARVPFFTSNMVKLTMGSKVTTLNAEAFYHNDKLRSVTLSENLAIVPDKAFYRCITLGGINIPASVKTIGANAFECDSLMTSVTLNEGLKRIDRFAFTYCNRVTSLTLPASIDTIHSDAFNAMSGVTKLTVTDSDQPLRVQDQRYAARGLFSDLAVTEAYVGRDIELVNSAKAPFYTLSTMNKVTLSDKVTQLCRDYFYNCGNLLNIYSKNPEPPTCPNDNVFYGMNTDACKVHVPASSVPAYKNATGWMLFFNNIVADDGGVVGDLNGDGIVDVTDVSIAIDVVLGKNNNPNLKALADINGDGQVDVTDVSMIIDIVLGKN